MTDMFMAMPSASRHPAPARILSVMTGPDRGTIWTLDGRETLVGRSAEMCAFVLHDRSVSRAHCRVFRMEEADCIEDAGSGNGTVVNGERIAGPTRLRQGDLVMLGSTVMRYQCVGETLSEAREGATASTTVTLSDLQIMAQHAGATGMENTRQSVAAITHALNHAHRAVADETHPGNYARGLLDALLTHVGTASRAALIRRPSAAPSVGEFYVVSRTAATPPLTEADMDGAYVADPPGEACVAPGDDAGPCVIRRESRMRDAVVWHVTIPIVWHNRVVAILYLDGVGALQRISNRDALLALTVSIGHAARLAEFG